MIELKTFGTTQKQMITWFYCASLFSSTEGWCTMIVCSYAGLDRKPQTKCLEDIFYVWRTRQPSELGSTLNQSPFDHTLLADLNIFRTWLNTLCDDFMKTCHHIVSIGLRFMYPVYAHQTAFYEVYIMYLYCNVSALSVNIHNNTLKNMVF